ncbi:unnamed protein product [Macrosiphum euphorbiae]|uniref:Uncharacterized protein n=1 Tax=Macrosiphum euphorbiae TaxID=13131 RepID=A0AAV0WIA0_9HEMI|nr:unnamed protein product [Macrosiphum euphorbiae]
MRPDHQNLIRLQKPKTFMKLNVHGGKPNPKEREKPETEKPEVNPPILEIYGIHGILEYHEVGKRKNGGGKPTDQKVKNLTLKQDSKENGRRENPHTANNKIENRGKKENTLFAVTTMEHQQPLTLIKTQNLGSVAQRKPTPTDRPTPSVEMKFPDEMVIIVGLTSGKNVHTTMDSR